MLTQAEQDKIWEHHQNHATTAFDLSYPRLRYLAERCRPEERVLTIGVGTGLLERLLVSRGVDVYCLDPSPGTIDRVRQELNIGEKAQHGYGQSMPFGSDLFDTVIMTEVLEHMPADVAGATLDQVRRVLKPAARFIGTVPYREDLQAGHVVCPHCASTFHRWGHEQAFDLYSLRALLERHGFNVERVYTRAFADFRRYQPKPLLRAVFRHLLGRLGEQIVGPNIYFAARKPAA